MSGLGTEIKSNQMVNSLLGNVTGLGVIDRATVGNAYVGGQLGTGIKFTKLDAASAVVFNPAVIVVLHTPSMWDSTPEIQQMLKSLVETHAKSITGLAFSYNVETADYPVGHDGQQMKVPTRTTRSQVSPSMTFNELTGGLVWNFFRRWMFDIQHPDTNASNLAAEYGMDQIPPWVMTSYSMSMLAIQFDATMLPDRIIDVAYYTNMFPTDIGELPIQRVIGTTEIQERTINFTGLVQHNDNVRELGYQVANMLQIHKINYNYALPGLYGTTVNPIMGSATNDDASINQNITRFGLFDEVYGTGYDTAQATLDTQGNVNSFIPYHGDNNTTESVTDNYTGSNQILTDASKAEGTDASYQGTAATTSSTTELA